MNSRFLTVQNLRSIFMVLVPLGLWLMLISSLQPGTFGDISNPSSPLDLIQGLRATLPLVAGFVGVVAIAIKMRRHPPRKILFLGPMGLLALYGLVGAVASILSPDGLQSLYWSASYLSVPLVLWAIVWGPNAIDWVSRVVNLNWLIVVAGSVFLFIFALFKLNFGSFLLSPSDWLDCSPQPWYTVTSHYIRQTGVGRYAAIAAILALSRLCYPQSRSIWVSIFLVSLVLLLYSGSRTPMLGFAAAAPIVMLLTWGRKAAVGAVAAVVLLVPVMWATGIHQDFLDNCVFRNSRVLDSISPENTQSLPVPLLQSPSSISPSIPLLNSLSPATSSQDTSSPTTSSPDKSDPATAITQALPTKTPLQAPSVTDTADVDRIPPGFFNFTGRTQVWKQALELVGDSPFLGYGFHADRLLLGTHAHNSVIHALLQTGSIGAALFIAALLLGWILLLRTLRRLTNLEAAQKILVIQTAGVLVFLSVRGIFESTGAFFGVDWLILGPLLLYIPMVYSTSASGGSQS